MREKTVRMIKRVHDELIKNKYITTYELSKKCNLKHWAVYAIIRHLRMKGIGVFATYKGYILSEFAQKQDDVTFIRRIFGRHTSDLIAIHAAEKDIRERWSAIDDKNNINNVLSYILPTRSNPEKANKSMKYMLSYVNGKGS